MSKRVLVLASTFPASPTDPVPAFVQDQVIAMKQINPLLELYVLAPHDTRSYTRAKTVHEHYTEYRFHYAWPFNLEKLAGQGGIMPQIKANPLYYLLIPFLFIGEFIALYRLTKRLEPDYLYAHWFTPQGVTSAWVSRLTGIPFVFTTHAADVDVWHKIPFIGRSIVRSHVSKARAITAVSPRSMAKLQNFFTPANWQRIQPRTKILPMGVHFSGVTEDTSIDVLKQRYNLTGRNVIFFMGRLAEKKGVQYLLKAVSSLDDMSSILVIAGDGPLKAQLEATAHSLNISEQVRFIGYISGDTKADYIALSDVIVLPSIITDDGDAEGLPVVFMEALAAGKVCIATNESGADTIITDGESGFLIPQKDSVAIRESLQRVNQLSFTERNQLQTKARSAAQQFDWPLIARQHLEFFDERLSS